MSTRHKRNSRLGRLVVPATCILLISYFAHHAINGRYGSDELARLNDEATRLRFELAGVREERKRLEGRVLLLHDGTLEADMLDERARQMLNLLDENELSLPRETAGRRSDRAGN